MFLVSVRERSRPSVGVRTLAPTGPRLPADTLSRGENQPLGPDSNLPRELGHLGFGHDQVGVVDQLQDITDLRDYVWLYQSKSSGKGNSGACHIGERRDRLSIIIRPISIL